jgi:hypothetical protein
MNMEEAKTKMKKLAENAKPQESGACVYNAGTGTYCAVMTPAQCAQLGGTYVGGTCN